MYIFLMSSLIVYSFLVIFLALGTFEPSAVLAYTIAQNRYQVYQDKVTWDDAVQICGTRDSKLAEILSYQQQKDLRTYIREYNLLPKDSKSGYWLGGRAENGKWRWDPTNQDPRGENNFMAGWHFGQPNGKVKDGIPQECMELQYITGSIFNDSLSWNDMWCDEKRGVICESWKDNPPPN